MRATAVPEVIDGLVALCKAALLANPVTVEVEVVDHWLGSYTGVSVLTVGASLADTASITATQQQRTGLGTKGRQEALQIVCELVSSPEEPELATRRAFVAAVLTQVDAAVRADRTLGGVCSDARLGPDMAWFQTGDGATGDAVMVRFTVTAVALL